MPSEPRVWASNGDRPGLGYWSAERPAAVRTTEYVRALPPTLRCITTDETGETGFVPLRDDTVSSSAAIELIVRAAAGWDQPLCESCQKPPKLKAFSEDDQNEELLVELEHDHPSVTLRLWVFDLTYTQDCGHNPALDRDEDAR